MPPRIPQPRHGPSDRQGSWRPPWRGAPAAPPSPPPTVNAPSASLPCSIRPPTAAPAARRTLRKSSRSRASIEPIPDIDRTHQPCHPMWSLCSPSARQPRAFSCDPHAHQPSSPGRPSRRARFPHSATWERRMPRPVVGIIAARQPPGRSVAALASDPGIDVQLKRDGGDDGEAAARLGGSL